MKHIIFTDRNVLLLITLFSFSFLFACSDDNDEPEIIENGEEEIWEPYQVKSNTSYQYKYERKENDELISEGIININIGDPEVEITGTIDGQDLNVKKSNSDDVTANFVNALIMTPAAMLYNPYWEAAFINHELVIGNSWSYPFGDEYYEFKVKGTDEYAGYEGYIVEMTYVDDSGTTDSWSACINDNIPLALMTHIIYDHGNPEEYYFELISYEE